MFEQATLDCQSLADAIPRVLSLVTGQGRIVLVRGEENREVLGVDVLLRDPTDRIPLVPGRRPITAFCVAEFLWYCSQRTDLASLEPYAPNISSFYGGWRSTTGSDYGRQLFGEKVGGSQWDKVMTVLRADPGSKRAFIAVYNADETYSLLPENNDVACTIGFQLLIRDERLHWVTTMRANDAYRGFVSDTFSFTMFHELAAATLGVPVGQYLHRPNSLHSFPEDQTSIRRIVDVWRSAGSVTESPGRMPPLSPEALWANLGDFWDTHEEARSSLTWDLLERARKYDDPWWTWAADELRSFHGTLA